MSGPKRISVSGPCSRRMCSTTFTALEAAAVVGLRLYLGRGVDVHDDDRVLAVAGLPVAQLADGDRVGERAAGTEVGDEDGLLGERIDAVRP